MFLDLLATGLLVGYKTGDMARIIFSDGREEEVEPLKVPADVRLCEIFQDANGRDFIVVDGRTYYCDELPETIVHYRKESK